MPSPRALGDAWLLGLARVGVSFALLAGGFRAVSDDDYARVVIAARFAAHPSLDPSGSSWLPLPFWGYGTAMSVFGDSLTTARATAVVLGGLSAVVLWIAARLLGSSRPQALVAGGLLLLSPYGAWLSAATVPEAPTAALILFGVVTLARGDSSLRLFGALALGSACWCRYDAWPPTAAFALTTAVEAARRKQPRLWLAAGCALVPVSLWLLHGAVQHGDALFFVARVRAYRSAIGQEPHGWWAATAQVLAAPLRFEPLLTSLALAALGFRLVDRSAPRPRAILKPLLALATLPLFLIIGDATGGSATHHPERSLLPVFWLLPLLSVLLVPARLTRATLQRLAPFVGAAVLAAWLFGARGVRGSFVDRRDEERIGGELRRRGERAVALDTDDFGFFALQAALGAGNSFALSDHDPRKPAAPRATSPAELAARVQGARFLVTTRERAALAAPLGPEILATPRLLLFELPRAEQRAR